MTKRKAKKRGTDTATPHTWRSTVRALLPFVATYLAFEAGLRVLASRGAFSVLQAWTAKAADALLELFGMSTVIADCSLVTSVGTVTVEPSCLPITPLALGLALIVGATRLGVLRKLSYVVVLVAALAVASVLRIALVTALLDSGSSLMAPVHETLSPIALVAVSLGVWLFALREEPRA